MRKRQTLISVLTLICSVCSLFLSTLAFLRADDTARVDDLIVRNAELQSQIDQLTVRLTAATEPTVLTAANAYSSLIVDSYTAGEDTLTLDTLYLQVQLPQSTTGAVTIRRCELIFQRGCDILYQQEVTLLPGEGEGGYELTLVNLTLPRPDMAPEDLLELKMEVTLSDGQVLHTADANWYESAGKLYLLVG